VAATTTWPAGVGDDETRRLLAELLAYPDVPRSGAASIST